MDKCTSCEKVEGTINIGDSMFCKACVIIMYKEELVKYVAPFAKPVLMSEFNVTKENGKLNFTYNKVMKVKI